MPNPELPPTELPNPQSGDLDRADTVEIVRLMFRQEAESVARLLGVALAVAQLAEEAYRSLKAGGRLIYVGAGTSGRLGVLDAVECVPTFRCDPSMVVGVIAGGPQALRKAVEGAEDNRSAGREAIVRLGVGERDTVVGIAACGHTPYVLAALEEAAARQARTGLISAGLPPNPPPLTVHIPLPAGPEILAGSTRLKAGTATKIILNAVSTSAMVRLGKVYKNLMVDLRPTNEKLRRRAVRLVKELAEVGEKQALRALKQADWEVKTAVLMLRRSLSVPQARKLLAASEGHLGRALAEA